MTLRGVTVILPVINECKNLEFLIPSLVKEIEEIYPHQYEIVVVDDGSTDGTDLYVSKIKNAGCPAVLINRKGSPSLPGSILDGINNAKFETIIWIDADGSMPAKDVGRLLLIQTANPDSVFIGSRFASGGGFKGIEQHLANHPIAVAKRIRASQDSVSAVVLSRLLNRFLRVCIRAGVKDLTSGFVIVQKSIIQKVSISGGYGDYFPRLVWELKKARVPIVEVGYICQPRKFGSSKTGTNLVELVQRGLPYVVVGVKIITEQTKSMFRRNLNVKSR